MFSTKLNMVASLRQLKCTKCFDYSLHHRILKNFSLSSTLNNDERSKEILGDKNGVDMSSTLDDKNVQADNDKAESESSSSLKIVSVIPGKGPPPEPPVTCCMTGCANCVWISYAEELKEYYGDVNDAKLLEQIEDPSLRAFIKLELGLK